MEIELGERVGAGRTSDVYAYGESSVIKVPHDSVPVDWPVFEASLARSVHEAGLPVPAVRDVVEADGKFMVVFERIDGPSMWQAMLEAPARVESMVSELAAIQRTLFEAGIPEGVPDFVDRLARRMSLVGAFDRGDRHEAVELAASLPRGAALLHGDLHPGNVLMGASGPIVIDWFDAAIGHPIADVVRTSLLLRPGTHLPGAAPEFLERLRMLYLREFADEMSHVGAAVDDWRAAIAAGRLAEHADADEVLLVQMWNARSSASRR